MLHSPFNLNLVSKAAQPQHEPIARQDDAILVPATPEGRTAADSRLSKIHFNQLADKQEAAHRQQADKVARQ
jgi:hypothetical protein